MIIEEFLLQDNMSYLFIFGETGTGKTQQIKAVQKNYISKHGPQSVK